MAGAVHEITKEIAEKVLSVVDAGLVRGVGNPQPGQMCVEAAVCYALGLPHGDNPQCVSRALRALKIRLNDSSWSSDAARAKGLRRLALIQLGSRDAIDDKVFVERVAKLAITKSVPIALRAAAKLQTNATHRQALLDAANRCEVEGSYEAAYAAAYAARAARAARAAAYAANAAANAAYAAADAAADAAAYAAANAAYAAADAADAAANANANANANAAAYAAYAARAAANAAYAANANARDSQLAEFAEDVVQILIDMKAPGAQWLDLAPLNAEAR